MFRTKFDRVRIFAEPGKPDKPVYSPKIEKNGEITLKETGKQNTYQYIQSFAESVDINVILAKFVNGDKDALNQREALFIDATDLPTNVFELQEFKETKDKLIDDYNTASKNTFDNVDDILSDIVARQNNVVNNSVDTPNVEAPNVEAPKVEA